MNTPLSPTNNPDIHYIDSKDLIFFDKTLQQSAFL